MLNLFHSLVESGKPVPNQQKLDLLRSQLDVQPVNDGVLLSIALLDQQYLRHFATQLHTDDSLTRMVVSFQDSRTRPVYRWYKYREAFSAVLVEKLLKDEKITTGKLLDPFAGSGTTLFAASTLGHDVDGIELLPIGQRIIETKRLLDTNFTPADFERVRYWRTQQPWQHCQERVGFQVLRITTGAYPAATQAAIEHYLAALQGENQRVATVLHFALLCVLESVSFTRKDGQYLRWDQRSGRSLGSSSFDKGEILDFSQAINAKITEILDDTADTASDGGSNDLFTVAEIPPPKGQSTLHGCSCLELLPQMPSDSYDAIFTSPPYCNRYDYTRTYALELAMLGIDGQQIGELRQAMLSCTVENREKDLLALNPNWEAPLRAAQQQDLLQAILLHLNQQKDLGKLNNKGIAQMVKGYFYEMSCVLFECLRLLKPGGTLFMVNDNVRYDGVAISVDLILSAIAEKLGFSVEKILVVPNGKGNSSQQMGVHGREALRKCIYIWKKP
jgi:DNA modification methylase